MIMVTDYEDEMGVTDVRTRYNAETHLRLYQNDYTPVPDSAAGNFTEANFPGYASENLTGDWSAPVKSADGKWYIEAPPITFSWSGVGSSNVIYGWYIDDGTDVVLAERLATPINMTSTSLPFRLTIRFTYESKAVL